MASWRRSVAGLAAALLAGACAPAPVTPPPGAEPAPAAPAAPAPPAAAQPRRGGVLQWAPIKGGQPLHPHRGGSTDILRHTGAGYETLLSFQYEPGKDYRESMEVIPWLADSWKQTDDLTYLVSIRRNVKWHDGTDFTAQDVAATFAWIRQEKAAASARLAQVETVEVTDPFTVKLTLKKATPDFLQELAERNLLIVAKHVLERGDDLNKVLMGTGPLKMKSFRSGVESIWERNNEYWQAGKPYLDSMRQVWGLEASSMIAAFVARENDLLATVDEAQLEAVRTARPEAGMVTLAAENGFGLIMKLDRPPFDDVRVRRALHLAVDREAMNQALAKGKGMHVTPGVWPGRKGWAIPQEELRKLPGYRTAKDADLAEARRLLAEAGYPQGLSFNIIYNGGGTAAPRFAEVIAAQVRSAGLTANLKPMESGVYNQADLRTGEWEGANLPTLVDSQFQGLFDRFHSQGPNNKVGLNDPKLDALIDATLTGKSEDARKAAARQLQEHFLQNVYYIPGIELVSGALWQPWVRDFTFTPGNAVTPYGSIYVQTWLDVDSLPAARR